MIHRSCRKCQAPLSEGTSHAFCAACLLEQGPFPAESEAVRASKPKSNRFNVPSLEGLAACFPQLELLDLIGAGGMGAVYRARQKALDRMVAVKILPTEVADDPTFAERFTREAKTLARLNHPNIVTLYEFGQSGDWFYLLMEYVDGINLRSAIQTEVLEPTEALGVVQSICDALQYAHEEGIVHRDIKPENILLDQRGRVKIADFGLAKLLDDSNVDVTLTQSQQVMGTWYYMAPEQWERPHEVDHRADLYSLGVVFYELLTGQLPIGRFALPSEKKPLDPQLDAVVLKALEREPTQRYQHASDLKTDLQSDRQRPPFVNAFVDPSGSADVGPEKQQQPDAGSNESKTVPSKEQEGIGSDLQGVASLKSIPFTLWWQGSEYGSGLARFTETHLVLEYQLTWSVYMVDFGSTKPGFYETGIPWNRLRDIDHRTRAWGDRLTLSCDSVLAVRDIPGCKQGSIELHIKRSYREPTVEAVSWMRGQVASAPTGESQATQQQSFHQEIGRSEPAAAESEIERPLDKIAWSMMAMGVAMLGMAGWGAFVDNEFISKSATPWLWLQGWCVLVGGIATMTRASLLVSRIGAVAMLIPISSWAFIVGIFLAIWYFNTAKQGQGVGEFVEARRRTPRLLHRWLRGGIRQSTEIPDTLFGAAASLGILSSTLFFAVGSFLIVMSTRFPDFWTQNALSINALAVPGLVFSMVGSFLILRKQAYGFALASVILGMIVLSLPQLFLLPISIWTLAVLLKRDTRRWFQTTPAGGPAFADDPANVAATQQINLKSQDMPPRISSAPYGLMSLGLLAVAALSLLLPIVSGLLLWDDWLVGGSATPAIRPEHAQASWTILVLGILPFAISSLLCICILGVSAYLTLTDRSPTAARVGAVVAMLPFHLGTIIGFPIGILIFWRLRNETGSLPESQHMQIPPTTI